MELVIHNSPVDVSVEELSTDQIRVHVSVDTSTDDLISAMAHLSDEIKAYALALWNDPAVSRKYKVDENLVIVTKG